MNLNSLSPHNYRHNVNIKLCLCVRAICVYVCVCLCVCVFVVCFTGGKTKYKIHDRGIPWVSVGFRGIPWVFHLGVKHVFPEICFSRSVFSVTRVWGGFTPGLIPGIKGPTGMNTSEPKACELCGFMHRCAKTPGK